MTAPDEPADEPTVLGTIMAVMAAAHRQGQAFAIADHVGARAAYREALAAVGRLLVMIGEDDPRPSDQEGVRGDAEGDHLPDRRS